MTTETTETKNLGELFAMLNKANLLQKYLLLKAQRQLEADREQIASERMLWLSDYFGEEWKSVNESIDILNEEVRSKFMDVAVPVLGSEGARVLVAETNGTYLIGLEDYNRFNVEIISITKSLYDALIENKVEA